MKQVKLMICACILIFTGCKSGDNSLAALRSHEWQLKSIMLNGETIPNPRKSPMLTFSDSTKLNGTAGCNGFFGQYTTQEGGKITIKPGGATMMYCPDMEFEGKYMKALAEVKKYSIVNEELKLMDAAGKLEITYGPVDSTKLVGGATDEHGCDKSAGYTWSEVRNDCIKIFEEGLQFNSATDKTSSFAAYVVFSADSSQVEIFIPQPERQLVLERRGTAKNGYVWNQEDDDTYNVRRDKGKWVIEQRGKILWNHIK